MPRKPSKTKFFEAIESGDMETVKLYFEKNGDLDIVNKRADPPLTVAINAGNEEVVRYLSENGADVNLPNSKTGQTPLIIAVKTGDYSLVQAVSENSDIDLELKDLVGHNVLYYSVNSDNLEITQFLLDMGAEISSFILDHAIQTNSTGMVKLLLNFGAVLDENDIPKLAEAGNLELLKTVINRENCDITDEDFNTPLNYACQRGDLILVEFLLELGSNPNIQNRYCDTPLISACKQDNFDIQQLLIKKKAKIDFKNFIGDSAVIISTLKQNIQSVRFMLDSGADVNILDGNGSNLLNLACHLENPNLDLVKFLLSKNIDIDNINRSYFSPLLSAVYYKQKTLAKLLIENKANVDLKRPIDGWTPLIFTITNKNLELTKLLLESGANPNLVSKGGVSALSFAVQYNDPNCVHLLLKHAAKTNIVDSDKNSELDHLAKYGWGVNVSNDKIKICKMLLDAGADVNYTNSYKRTNRKINLLHGVVGSNNLELLKLLVEKGIDLSTTDRYGKTALQAYSWYKDYGTVKYLTEIEDLMKAKADKIGACGD